MAAIQFVGADFAAISRLETIPGNGIIPISLSQRDRKMLAFNYRMYDMYNRTQQPSFFISWDSWEKLMNGLGDDGSRWLPRGYEVYGFAFCIAFKKYRSDYRNYFRIRTIIKNKKDNTIWVEIDNIAFADLKKVDRGEEGCLTFINPLASEGRRQLDFQNTQIREYKRIMREMAFAQRPISNFNEIRNLEPQKQEQAAKNQEGFVFGKNSPFLKNLKKKGYLISLGWTPETRLISFLFSVNPHGETVDMPCPVPYTACN